MNCTKLPKSKVAQELSAAVVTRTLTLVCTVMAVNYLYTQRSTGARTCTCTHTHTHTHTHTKMMWELFSDLSSEEGELYVSVTQKDMLVELLVFGR